MKWRMLRRKFSITLGLNLKRVRRLDRPLEGERFNMLSNEDKCILELPFEESEIKQARISHGSSLAKSITSSFLALIPKSNNPLGLDDYRPICLVGSIHKIISKALAGRIKQVIGKVISSSQSAFVPGRQLLDGALVANELVDYASKEKKEVLLFKVDFEKAYDKVNWEFLQAMLIGMGFGDRWLKWMDAIVFSSHMSVLVNGSPTKEFKVEKGLRQGDPISPFLFGIVAEGLEVLVNGAVENGDFAGFTFKRRCFIDMLQFADDTLLIGDGSWSHLWAIKSVLSAFETISGGKGKEFTFLGLPIGSNPRRINTWEPLVVKVRRRLASWKGRYLSFGGRLTLIKAVLSSLAIFYLSFYKAPKKVIKEINCIQSNFLWGGTEDKRCTHWWKWRILDKPESLWYGVLKARYGDVNLKMAHAGDSSNGGNTSFWHSNWTNRGPLKDCFPLLYSLSSLQDVSVALMGSWIGGTWKWGDFGLSRFAVNSRSNFAAAHFFPAGLSLPIALLPISSTAGSIPNLSPTAEPLQENHSLDTYSMVGESMENLLLDLQSVSLEFARGDSVSWRPDKEGIFSVKSCYEILCSNLIPFGPEGEFDKALMLVWKVEAPLKSKAFIWRSFINRIPTRGALYRKGIIPFTNSVCAFCCGFEEDPAHLLLNCHCVELVWKDIAKWIGFDNY
ncbi:uncharacterized protein LOC131632671 [Vicia villosa]|uniref:uncharacterized protein LOC131632671 n=1 Tax=Vicia villosa TaxID=3911 RepID=UPI00273C6C14|nr:uncharacterized protein LOC131632671 [Vicia villosa]